MIFMAIMNLLWYYALHIYIKEKMIAVFHIDS